ncbi:protein dispatched [Anopheles merus]|uniref:SSD domain-containing protein n=1 Tax=Anopheles merus TaxID=30066 RepID=A0A182UYA9_ANOME|nr:protein dispatched [Anopheles merus]XP_041788244.1 protein dispatched [Anopheles merus]XP_041788245.1 protein dispatched [Anopheles merus]
MLWYYKLLARRPHLVLVAVGIFSVACIVVALCTRKLPDFDDPTLGFEARGTSIGKRWTAWRNLLEETSLSGRLVANPKELTLGMNNHFPHQRLPPVAGDGSFRKRRKNKGKKKTPNTVDGEDTGKAHGKLNKNLRILKELYHNQSATNGEIISFEEYDNETMPHRGGRQEVWEYGRNQSYYTEEVGNKTMEKKRAKWDTLRRLKPPPEPIETHIPSDGFFCESPNKEYAHLVVQRINHNLNDSLFELNAFLALCELEQRIFRVDHYGDICQRELTSEECCRPWSIVNYVTFLSNKTSCFELNEEDVAMVKTLLYDCFSYYQTMKLSNDCTQSSCFAPSECKQHNAVYNILHYLANVDFIRQNESAEFLNATMIFLPIARSIKSMEFYHSLSKVNLANDLVSVVAMDMGLKNALFDECLLRDGWLLGLGGIFVVLCMWLYTGSLFVTLMTVTAVAFSLGIAYFIYSFIFELTFFPFMNLLAVIVVVGIGADDAFIFLKIWQCTIAERLKCGGGIVIPIAPSTASCNSEASGSAARGESDTLVEIMGSTLRHAALSMLVTSLTTAAAFYASYVSSITAVRCFGIFSGTAVMANYFLMVTWLPAAVSIAERLSCLMLLKPFGRVSHRCTIPFISIAQLSRRVEETIIDLIVNLPWLWVTLLGTVGIMSGVLVLHWPKLRLPDSPDFKLFISNHPFERYDSEYRDMFWFEKMYSATESFKIPLRFVWGVQPVDRGDLLDPEQRGALYFDESFNMSAPESQQWLLQFCRRIKNQTFYSESKGLLVPNCFIENFIEWMRRRCNDTMGEIDRTPCCEVSPFPFTPDIFDQCLPESILSLYETPRQFFVPGVAGPKFARSSFLVAGEPLERISPKPNDTVVKAVVIEFESTQIFTMSYTEIDAFVRTVERWLAEQLRDAPPTMANAWFTSELEFFDLQDTLSTGTMVAIAMAMAVALLVLMLVTLNVLISLYAIVTVTLTILTTVAVLVLLGWKLNVLESVAVSTAIGLAVDFSLHYGVHYRLSTEPDRRSSTRFSLQRMLGPTAMAAITTGIAGALMLPSSVLAYIQIGVFLVIVMSISWLYATFFLMSLLRLIGPQYGFGQFRYPKLRSGLRSSDGCKATAQLDTAGARLGHHHSFHMSHHHQGGVVTEQLLSNSSSTAGDLVGSESHELDSLTSNSIIKPINLDIARPINFDRAFKKKYSLPREQSPSTASAITMVLPDDVDLRGGQ